MSILHASRPTFSLESLPALDGHFAPEAPSYYPSREELAWELGFELEQMGERAMIRTIDGYTASEHLAFANGQRAARQQMATIPAIPVRMTPDELAEGLRTMAAWCAGQGGQLGAMAAYLLRQGAKDCSYYRCDNPADYEAREAEMIETLQRCSRCESMGYEEVVL